MAALLLAAIALPAQADDAADLKALVEAQGQQIEQMKQEIDRLKSVPTEDTPLERDINAYLAQTERGNIELGRTRGGGPRRWIPATTF